ncbi:MAG: hypothetical protein ABIB93_02545, partial [Chloroflexota bacterium]
MKHFIKAAWSPVLITILAIVGYLYEWPVELLSPALVVILVVGLVVMAVSVRERKLEHAALKLDDLARYFNRRFADTSSLSIFTIINSLSSLNNPGLLEWVRACNTSQVIFNAWCNGFTSRLGSDARTARFGVHLRGYLSELWLLVIHYHEFVEAFYEVAVKIEIPQETIDHYNRFSLEYNSFVQSFQ